MGPDEVLEGENKKKGFRKRFEPIAQQDQVNKLSSQPRCVTYGFLRTGDRKRRRKKVHLAPRIEAIHSFLCTGEKVVQTHERGREEEASREADYEKAIPRPPTQLGRPTRRKDIKIKEKKGDRQLEGGRGRKSSEHA